VHISIFFLNFDSFQKSKEWEDAWLPHPAVANVLLSTMNEHRTLRCMRNGAEHACSFLWRVCCIRVSTARTVAESVIHNIFPRRISGLSPCAHPVLLLWNHARFILRFISGYSQYPRLYGVET
jgi:hypothetical protein